MSTTCALPQTIQPGGSLTCSFTATVSGNAGDLETDTVTATGADDDGNAVSGSDSATVTVTDVLPSIGVTKTASPTTVAEPGGPVTFSVSVENTSNAQDPVTITSLTDDIHGDLSTICGLPQTIQPGSSLTCSFTATVSGNAGDSETDTVTAAGTDDDGNAVSGSDSATVTVTDVLPSIGVTKTASPTTVVEPGGPVTFSVSVENTSNAQDPVTITSLTDDIHGDLSTTCALPQTIQPGSSLTCSFTATVSGNAGDSETDTVTATGADDDGNAVSGSDSATVTVTASVNVCDLGEKPQVLTMTYTGDGDDATSHSQDTGKVVVGGDPNDASTVFIVASNKASFNKSTKIWFQGTVNLNGTFNIDAANAGANRLRGDTVIQVFTDDGLGTLLQTVKFHTSCSQPLFIGDQYGSVSLTGFVGEGGTQIP